MRGTADRRAEGVAMDIFFRDFDAAAPLATGPQWLAALTARIALAMFVYSRPYLDIGSRLLLSAQQAWVLCFILAAWFALSIFPATAGLAELVNGFLLLVGAVELLDRIKEIVPAFVDGLQLAYAAKSHDELKAAGKAFAPALSGTVVTTLELLVSYGAFKAAEAAVLRRIPAPGWFEEMFGKAAREAESGKPARQEPTSAQRQATKESSQQSGKPGERFKTATKVVKGAVALEGARKTAENLSDAPIGWILAGAGVVAVGLTATVLVARRGKS